MRRRIAAAAGLFMMATMATAMLGRWFPPPLEAPAAALVLAALGALLIGLAPSEATVATAASIEVATSDVARLTPVPLLEAAQTRITSRMPTPAAAAPMVAALEPEGMQPEGA